MQLLTAKIYGWLIGLLGVAGLFITSGHLFGFMNADLALDILRLAVAALLLYAAYNKNVLLAKNGLLFVGILYIGMAIGALIDGELWGLLPNGLTGFDIVFHLVTGLPALAIGAMKPKQA